MWLQGHNNYGKGRSSWGWTKAFNKLAEDATTNMEHFTYAVFTQAALNFSKSYPGELDMWTNTSRLDVFFNLPTPVYKVCVNVSLCLCVCCAINTSKWVWCVAPTTCCILAAPRHITFLDVWTHVKADYFLLRVACVKEQLWKITQLYSPGNARS